MHDNCLNRRRLLAAMLAYSTLPVGALVGLRTGTAWGESREDAELVRLARLLFPHDGLSDEVYASVMGKVLRNLAAAPATAELLDTVQAELDARQESHWIDLDEPAQVAALRNIQGEAYFAAILGAVRLAFYTDPAVWQHIDYPGSSKEYGGYKDRGFDDIDWLPKANS
jgi:hypothetical protein